MGRVSNRSQPRSKAPNKRLRQELARTELDDAVRASVTVEQMLDQRAVTPGAAARLDGVHADGVNAPALVDLSKSSGRAAQPLARSADA
jgi:hypothetical protein